MDKILKRIIEPIPVVALLTFLGWMHFSTPPKKEVEYKLATQEALTRTKEPLSRAEKLNQIAWYVIDSNGDGCLDQLRRPRTPIYTSGQGDSEGECALDAAKELVGYKNDFSRMTDKEGEFPWLCRVDDFDEDGSADRISWPRLGDRMPVFEKPFPKGVQKKADMVVFLENHVLDYVR